MKSRLMEVFVLCLALVLKANAQTPVITSEPQSITVNNASAATFTVTASNAASYQWQLDTTNLPGETNATLSLDDVSTNQAGSYTVVVTSPSGNAVTSAPPAVLTIVPGTIVQFTISTYPGGGSSNFLVQLFDHDKPATVENFLHYIITGSYSNMIFDRDVANFVLQGGDLDSSDRSATNLYALRISPGTNVFPSQVDNEFGYGPLIHNHFGTLAMALASGNTNSASTAFFFNLVDNSGPPNELDSQDFTVFGRILGSTNASENGANILQYFNTLSPPDHGIYPYFNSYPDLPVNYDTTNEPEDANLFYCDFSFPNGQPALDTTPPTVAITFPTPNEQVSNNGSLTAMGTASDNVSVANVTCVLKSLKAGSGTLVSNYALGTTQWSMDFGVLAPGPYQLKAYAQDGEGNTSAPVTTIFTNLAELTIITNLNGELTSNEIYLTPGQQYTLTAMPPAGAVFLDWQIQGVVSLDPVQEITADSNYTVTVTFAETNGFPAGLAITSPLPGSTNQATNANLTISGTLPTSVNVTQVTVQLFLQSEAVTPALPAVINGATWSVAESGLAGGLYTVEVVADDSAGQEGVATETFTALAPPIIYSQPTNLTILAGSTAYFTVGASNAASYQWILVGTGPIAGATTATLALEDVTTNQSGSSYLVVVTSSDGESVTNNTPAVLNVVSGTLVQITFSGFPDGSTSNVLVQLFDHEKPATVANFLHYITPAYEPGSGTNVAYSNMIWDRCIPGFLLQGGDYAATDQTNGTPPPQLKSINEDFTQAVGYLPPFPFTILNESAVGPLIPNTFGTLAMATTAGEPDSAANAFFFNLADNSATLDTENGGYTVFGQTISGSNVLQYFNTLSKPAQGIFDSSTVSSSDALANLPVNYHGWLEPANSSLFFAKFTLLSTFNPDTNPPTLTLNYPASGQTTTNADFVMQGTAADNVAVARVVIVLDHNPYTPTGTTNWSYDFGLLAPGTHSFNVVAQDGSGNETPSTKQPSGTFVVPRFPYEAIVNGAGTVSNNVSGTNTTIGSKYQVTAKPDKGAVFVNWVMGSNTFLSATTNFTMQNGLQMTANFISNVVPAGVSITFPLANAQLAGSNFVFKGKASSSLGAAQITCQVFSASTSNSVSAAMACNVSGTSWTAPAIALAPGNYIAQAIAQGANGKSAVTTVRFTVLAQLTVLQYGKGNVTIKNGAYFKLGAESIISAAPAAGYSFLSWNAGTGSIPESQVSFTMTEGLTLTVTFVSNSLPNKLTFTTPVVNTPFTNKNVTVGGKVSSSVVAPQVFCQVFVDNEPLTGFMPATVNGQNWSLLLTNLGIGAYKVVALVTDEMGRTTQASDQFTVNFYPLLAGIYHGLFFDPYYVSPGNAGAVALALGTDGQVDGNVVFGNTAPPLYPPYVVDFQLGATGSITLESLGYGGQTVQFVFSFDVTNYTTEMTGSVTQYGQTSPMIAYRTVKKLTPETMPATGTYALDLEAAEPGEGPLGDGFANVIVSPSGNLAVAGTLADDSSFSFSTGASTNGQWPVFASFNKGKGMVIGWESSSPSGISGPLYWVKSANSGLYYTNSVNEQLNSVGEKFVKPAAGVDYQIVFSGGSLTSPVTNVCSFKNGVIEPAEGTTDKLTGTLTSMGVLKGSIVNPFNNQKLPFSGAFINPTNGGAGFTLDVDKQTGAFTITPE